MLAILLLVFAGFNMLGTLAIIANSKIPGGTRAFMAMFNIGMVVVMVLSAIALMC